jgi:tetratricopeptide (TPR) repeat protein
VKLIRYNLGALYESCENQTTDALDAYAKALELDPNNNVLKTRLNMLKNPSTKPRDMQPLEPLQPVPLESNSPKFPTGAASQNPAQIHNDRQRRQSNDVRPDSYQLQKRGSAAGASSSGQHVIRGGYEADEQDHSGEVAPTKRRLAPVDMTEPKRYKPLQQ